MTTRRLIVSLTASAAALALAAAVAVRSFPLEAQERAVAASDEPVQLIAGAEHLLHGERPEYPRRAIEHNVGGDVIVDMTLNDRGEVSDARVLSGPEELRRATLESVLQWHYVPEALSSTDTRVTVRFQLAQARQLMAQKAALKAAWEEKVEKNGEVDSIKHRLLEIERAIEDPSTPGNQREELKMMAAKSRAELEELVEIREKHEFRGGEVGYAVTERSREKVAEGPQKLVHVRTERVSPEIVKELLQHAGVAMGDEITEESAKRLSQAAESMDEHIRVEFQKEKGGLVLTVLTR